MDEDDEDLGETEDVDEYARYQLTVKGLLAYKLSEHFGVDVLAASSFVEELLEELHVYALKVTKETGPGIPAMVLSPETGQWIFVKVYKNA